MALGKVGEVLGHTKRAKKFKICLSSLLIFRMGKLIRTEQTSADMEWNTKLFMNKVAEVTVYYWYFPAVMCTYFLMGYWKTRISFFQLGRTPQQFHTFHMTERKKCLWSETLEVSMVKALNNEPQ